VGDAAGDRGSRLFEAPLHRTFTQRLIRPAEDVTGAENTGATSLSWPDDVRCGFTAELRRHLRSLDGVPLTLEASVTMARQAGESRRTPDQRHVIVTAGTRPILEGRRPLRDRAGTRGAWN
jgi:hypothetical protein